MPAADVSLLVHCSCQSARQQQVSIVPPGGQRSTGLQLQGQVQFVPNGNAELAHDRDSGFMCSCSINSSRPECLQSKASSLVESQRIQVVVRGSQPKQFKAFQAVCDRLHECRSNSLMANKGTDRHEFSDRPISARHSRNSLEITSDKDIARIDPVELRPHHDRIAPLSDQQIDGDSTLARIRQTDQHLPSPSPNQHPPNCR